VACKKKNTPAKPCGCSVNTCDPTCFTVKACGVNANGATVDVYETNAPSVILATGNTNSAGRVCIDLTNHASKAMSASFSFGSGNDYAAKTTSLLGSPCGRSYTATLTPATDAATNAETNGTVNVTFTRCDGTTPWTNATVEIKVSLDVEGTGTTNATGQVSITVPTGVSYYVRAYRPTDNSPLNSGTFTLGAGKCADALIRRSNDDGTPCNPDTEAVVTVRDCTPGVPAGDRQCCAPCAPDTIPTPLYLDDPGGWSSFAADTNRPPVECTTVSESCTLTGSLGGSWSGTMPLPAPVTLRGGAARYIVTCRSDGVYLSKQVTAWVGFTDPYGYLCASYLYGTTIFGKGQILTYSVKATSVTCDPFSATFDMPEKIVPLVRASGLPPNQIPIACTNCTLPPHTITVTE
jgi:hypothetical protein